jgi:hypothetical protein
MTRPPSASSGVLSGTLFSALQATTHAWQPVHLSKSMTIAHRGITEILPKIRPKT